MLSWVRWDIARTGAMDDFLENMRFEVTCAGIGKGMAVSVVFQRDYVKVKLAS